MSKYIKRKLPVFDRFKQRYIISETGCWEWIGRKNKDGYGCFLDHEKAHRASYKFFIGEIPPGLYICHKCDNPGCVNPFHLFAGTQLDNMRDAYEKGRRQRATHPSVSAYSSGCRCKDCTKMAVDADRKRRAIKS